jgi:hypothetical protein
MVQHVYNSSTLKTETGRSGFQARAGYRWRPYLKKKKNSFSFLSTKFCLAHLLFIFFFYSYVHTMFGSFLPSSPCPLPPQHTFYTLVTPHKITSLFPVICTEVQQAKKLAHGHRASKEESEGECVMLTTEPTHTVHPYHTPLLGVVLSPSDTVIVPGRGNLELFNSQQE